jgi:trk system potassium uptake protein TrkA
LNIIIVGAGQIGRFVASKLSKENKDVIVIEEDERRIAEINEELDVQVIRGNGASPNILREAGVNKAQMIVAVTDSDEVNILSCLMSNMQTSVPVTVARVRDPGFYEIQDEEIIKKMDIDMIINPEKEAADAILRILSVPGSLEVMNFFGGKMKLAGVRAKRESEITGKRLDELQPLNDGNHLLITAIVRDGESIIPSGKSRLLEGDLVYFIAKPDDIPNVMKLFGYESEKVKRVMIVGGGYMGMHLAKILEQRDIQVKIIEPDAKLCSNLVRNLDKSVVLNEAATDQALLVQENVKDMDAFISITPDDENNILSSLLAKRLGTPWTISLTNEINYIPLVRTIGVDVVISPRLIANNKILHFIRQGKVLSVFAFQEDIEILEIEALETSDILGKPLKDAKIPKGVLVIAVERDGEVMIPDGNTIIKSGDKVLVQATTKSIPGLEKLFTVKLEYF